MPLFIDRLPFHCRTDPTRSPPLSYWTVALPVMVAEPTLIGPLPVAQVQEWALDTGNRGEAFAWRHHLLLAGLDPDQGRLPQPMTIRTVTGKVTVPVRDVDLWLVSNLPVPPPDPFMTKSMGLFGGERSGKAFVEFFQQQLDVFD